VTRPGANPRGTLCLLHLSGPTATSVTTQQNPAADLPARLAEHEAGRGSRLLQLAEAARITWTLARAWPGGPRRERQLKNQGSASPRCPNTASSRTAIQANVRRPPA
jgi:hypothetical protein